MHSAIYHGTVYHSRAAPARHSFSYRMFMMYLDLAELPRVFAGSRWFSASRAAAARFCREDHLGEPGIPLEQAVRDLVEQRCGRRPAGPIRLLTHLRYFGHIFNPVSFYYCFDAADTRVETIVAEVNNTPWGERHCYVLTRDQDIGSGRISRFRPGKQMHVSPFMPMDVDYDWRFAPPGESLTVHMKIDRRGIKLFDATLRLRRREITTRALARTLLAFPLMTVRVVTAIYWQALRLWLKGCVVYDHPAKTEVRQRAKSAASGAAGSRGHLMERTK